MPTQGETYRQQNMHCINNIDVPKRYVYRKKRMKHKHLIITLCYIIPFFASVFLGYIMSEHIISEASNNANMKSSVTTESTAATKSTETTEGTALKEEEPDEIPSETDISETASTKKVPIKSKVEAASSPIPLPQEENDMINIIAASRQQGTNKRCYLTFDDGPSVSVTGEILEILAKYNIKATFFEVGQNITNYPDITKRVYDEGHLVANHSYSHDYNRLYATEDSFRKEIINCEKAIKKATGHKVSFKCIRFPGGSYNAGDHAAEKQIYKQTLADMGYYYCDWNTLNGDAEGAPKDTTGLFEFFKSSAASFIPEGKNLIVLMHDTDAKQSTADALESIITYLIDNDYTFHRLDDITLQK